MQYPAVSSCRENTAVNEQGRRRNQTVKNNLTVKQIRRYVMKSSTKDKTEGTFHQVKGKVKEVAGKISDNPKLEAEGTIEKSAGKVQKKSGEVKKVLGK
jgi:uncharacterized protein YjbJ (UPF0337 family)